jgi:flagellar P-ring protein precursor FlgI
METKNVAAVVISGTLPPFAKGGSRLDVTVSSIGSASSLEGGTLLATPLRAADGNAYAMAQGRVTVPRKGDAGGKSGGAPVTGLVLGGAIIEREIQYDYASKKELTYAINQPDFTTAARMAQRINEELGGKYAIAEDAATVNIILPYTFDGTAIDLIARIEGVEIEADRKAKVVVNARTGTVVLGENVQIAPVAIAHNNLKIEIKEKKQGKDGKAEDEAESTTITKRILPLHPGPSIADVAASLNEIGATSEDLVNLLQALKASGALIAELEFQ